MHYLFHIIFIFTKIHFEFTKGVCERFQMLKYSGGKVGTEFSWYCLLKMLWALSHISFCLV